MKGIGLLKIHGGLLCQKDTLGQQFCGKISGIDVTILFPSLADDSDKDDFGRVGMGNPLLAPGNGTGLTLGGENILWGYPMTAPKMNSFVNYVTLELDCDEHNANEMAQKLYAGAQDWAYSFKCFLQLLTKQQLAQKPKVSNPGNNLQLLFDGKYADNHHPQVIHAQFHSDSEFASHGKIFQAIEFASSGKELFLEYQMLLSAYNARKDGANRQAIIDACSAVEICLVNWINCYCNQKGFSPKILTEKYRSLGERFNLVKSLDSKSPSIDFANIIVRPRNAVAHNRNVFPTKECTDQLIEMVEKYLEHYHTSYY